jgi:4-amino-4-deoxy-L-arabinose transferase-like glycosyltransferase
VNQTRLEAFCSRRYTALAAGVLLLAACNLFVRLDREFVTEWDEALYAISASELIARGDWIGVTFLGQLDYYNTKPPLNVWLVALAFKVFGPSLVSLRLPSVTAALLTVAVLMYWSRRAFGPAIALFAGLVLSTTFGFLHVHSARSANTDALFTLLVLLTVVSLWEEERGRWHRVWLGPLLAGTFLLRGFGVLMPLTIVLPAMLRRSGRQSRWILPSGIALLLFLVPVTMWAVARYRLDEWTFFERMFHYDFLARSLETLEQHAGGPVYYPLILIKHHYEWILTSIVAFALAPIPWSRLRARIASALNDEEGSPLLVAWAASTLLIPTLMRTKLPWYLNTFYPLFALIVAGLLVRAWSQLSRVTASRARLVALSLVAAVALTASELRLFWYSIHFRDLSHSAQGLLLDEPERLAGRVVYRDLWDRSAMFVTGLVGAEFRHIESEDDFLRQSSPGDFLLTDDEVHQPGVALVRSNARHWLYVRIASVDPRLQNAPVWRQ